MKLLSGRWRAAYFLGDIGARRNYSLDSYLVEWESAGKAYNVIISKASE